MNSRRHFLRRLIGSLAVGTAGAAALLAGPKKRPTADNPSASPTLEESPTEKKDNCLLRVWKASEAPDLEVQLRLLPYGKTVQEAISPLKIEAGNYQFSDYVEVPSGPFTAEISAADRPTVRLPLYLEPSGQLTMLVQVKGSTLSVERIDDVAENPDNSCEFSVYNLLPASGDIHIDLGSVLSVHLSTNRGSVRLHGIKRAVYPITAEGTDDKGKSFRWNTDADFRHCRKATLLIYPDAYGRVRPRVNEI